MNFLFTKNSRHEKGFTLVEILLAMLITTVLVLGVNTAYRKAYIIWANAENRRPIYYTARILTDTFRQELSGLYIPPENKKQESKEKSFKLLYLPEQGTELTFYTLTPSWRNSPESSRMAKVSYKYVQSDSGEIQLERYEQPCASETIISNKVTDIIKTNLSEIKLWVIDPNSESSGNEWIESYESDSSPPKAVKICFSWKETEVIPETELTQSITIYSDSSLL